MLGGIELAKDVSQQGHIGQFVEGDAIKVEIAVGVSDAARGHLMAQAGQRCIRVKAAGRFSRGFPDVGY